MEVTRTAGNATKGPADETTGAQAPLGIPLSVQISDLRLYGSRGPGGTYREMPVPDRFRHVPAALPADAVLNVAQMYSRLAGDIHSGDTSNVPDFSDAVHAHRLLDTIRSSR